MPFRQPPQKAERYRRTRFNLRLFLWLLLPAILIGLGLYGAHTLQVKRTARSFLAQANRAHKEGDGRKAELYLKRFLVFEPQHAQALGQLGLVQSDLARSADLE